MLSHFYYLLRAFFVSLTITTVVPRAIVKYIHTFMSEVSTVFSSGCGSGSGVGVGAGSSCGSGSTGISFAL